MKKALYFFLAPFLLSLLLAGCGQYQQSSTGPFFTDPAARISELSDPSFTVKLFYEALALEAKLTQRNCHVHMGYWSRSPNRDNIMRLLDAVNSYSSTETHRAVWDEGTTTSTAYQYPSYVRMNLEYWYERAAASGDGTVVIGGVRYTDPYRVTTAEADIIWGKYSQRYADMASLIRTATGMTVESWCFVQGARANRIFYSYELPVLVSLEAAGDVYVHFATTYEASWLDQSKWITGTRNAPTPEPASL